MLWSIWDMDPIILITALNNNPIVVDGALRERQDGYCLLADPRNWVYVCIAKGTALSTNTCSLVRKKAHTECYTVSTGTIFLMVLTDIHSCAHRYRNLFFWCSYKYSEAIGLGPVKFLSASPTCRRANLLLNAHLGYKRLQEFQINGWHELRAVGEGNRYDIHFIVAGVMPHAGQAEAMKQEKQEIDLEDNLIE
ncbi:hypothetical protein P691DRAFT_791178 [Macrolepiota fuliginosa MF-IS2]|uniref:Uncharacterized protein n=1 Tax=Macrolepiota fuliginosa MF-IS2 TaxID=1400762 RepID=A0A9P5XER9_9AGAR|nr:hypothetical protein P691DRAFT_791178 [Macrolepiota fuliginosa MF-IS2]